jgi:hypothetical protein
MVAYLLIPIDPKLATTPTGTSMEIPMDLFPSGSSSTMDSRSYAPRILSLVI